MSNETKQLDAFSLAKSLGTSLVETITVKSKQTGANVVINRDDYSPKLYERIDEEGESTKKEKTKKSKTKKDSDPES